MQLREAYGSPPSITADVDMIIELGRRDQNPEGKRERIERLLRGHMDVLVVLVGEEFDLWHGDFHDLLDSAGC